MQKGRIVVLVFLSLLVMSWLPNSSYQKETLELEITVVDLEKGIVEFKVIGGEPTFELTIMGGGGVRIEKFEQPIFQVSGIKEGEYFFVVLDSKLRIGQLREKI